MPEQICKITARPFTITESDQAFYRKLALPWPTLCPEERQRRRLAWRNERTLYRRNCSATGAPIISIYHPAAEFPVYSQDFWWTDRWDARSYGRDFDFSRTFFEQFGELQKAVPRIAMLSVANENSEFVNLSSWNRDCYLLFESDNNRECYYCDHTFYCTKCADLSYCRRCELCLECIYCDNCYDSKFLTDCETCAESFFLRNCIGCSNCFGCVNLRNKRYYVFNKSYSKEQYFQYLAELQLSRYSALLRQFEECERFSRMLPRKYYAGRQNEDITGNYIWNCKDVENCYDVRSLRNCKFVCNCENSRDCYDIDVYGGDRGMELVYEGHSVGNGCLRCFFGTCLFEDCVDVCYSDFCNTSEDLFGCISLRRARYCILNKEYGKDEYFRLRARIVEHMKATAEWGEFFPIKYSPFGYNETVAQEYYPLGKAEILTQGWRWREPVARPAPAHAFALTDSLAGQDDSVCAEVLTCTKCGLAYQMQKPEFLLYQQLNTPLPRSCFSCRYLARMNKRAPRKLVHRQCRSCKTPLLSPYTAEAAPDVLCERCYNEIAAL